jgi:hypothetical protein
VWKDATKKSLIWELLKVKKFIAIFYTYPLGKKEGSGQRDKNLMKELFLITLLQNVGVIH